MEKKLSLAANHSSFAFTHCTRKGTKWKAKFGHGKALYAPPKKHESHHALIDFRCKKNKNST
jgi:hypothetical protein